MQEKFKACRVGQSLVFRRSRQANSNLKEGPADADDEKRLTLSRKFRAYGFAFTIANGGGTAGCF
jgi:hypothetical protein